MSDWSRGVRVGLAVVLTVAMSGYYIGLRESRQNRPGPSAPRAASPSTAPQDVLEAVAYLRQQETKLGPNRDWKSSLAMLSSVAPPPPSKPPTDDERQRALAQRAQRRAFEGAPPTIPHPITQMTSATCLACHERGMKVGELVASKMSHPPYASCTQCHVETRAEALPPWSREELAPGNLFTPRVLSTRGDRAFAGAPPSVPHEISMRTDCLSCHGPFGNRALQTTHPERQSCLQCHPLPVEAQHPPFVVVGTSHGR
jgi:cytochrome c-type protein NapB